MNKNSYFNEPVNAALIRQQIWDRQAKEDLLGYNMPQKKEKTMDHYKEFPFHCEWQSFKTLAEATVFARKQVMNSKEDVVIKQNVAIVKFPVPDYEVETLATVA